MLGHHFIVSDLVNILYPYTVSSFINNYAAAKLATAAASANATQK
jgi:hypothetical protein